jgi:uncharacterized protein with HEPN domain
MERDPRSWLWDVIEAARAIQSFVHGLDSSAYASQALVHSAVERKFEIMGEAPNQLSKAHPALGSRIPQLQAIVGFRNLLIHGYADVKHETVWKIVHQSLPELLTEVQAVLDELPPAGGSP